MTFDIVSIQNYFEVPITFNSVIKLQCINKLDFLMSSIKKLKSVIVISILDAEFHLHVFNRLVSMRS